MSNVNPEWVRELLRQTYGDAGEIIIGRAPGRVNLIGEHTDYNEGFVFPMAIDFQILLGARRRSDSLVRIKAADCGEMVEFSLNEPLVFDDNYRWSNYLRGVFSVLRQTGLAMPGMEVVFAGDIPLGAGLSSSAALEVATAIVIQRLAGFSISRPDLARLCQRAENEFVGMNCGIMDQFISMMGETERALFLDCRSLEYKQVPLELGDYRIVICQSGVKHSLVDSEYNRRRLDCEQGVAVLARHYPNVQSLRDVDLDQLLVCQQELDPVVYRRCRHVISENQRVLESVNALHRQDLATFGKMMNLSHDSLRDLYEVSCPEVDLLVDLARQISGVLGSRITGGGFGGCTVNLVDKRVIPLFAKQVLEEYHVRTGIKAQLFISTAANGAEILDQIA